MSDLLYISGQAMLHNFLYQSGLHSVFLNLLNVDRGIRSFFEDVALNCPEGSTILDAGCGPGTVGLTLLKHIPDSVLLAADIHEKFLQQTVENCSKMSIDQHRVETALIDISKPDIVRCACPGWKRLEENYFDVVNASGVIGYAEDPWKTIETLLRLVKKSGYFLDLEMDESLVGKMMSSLYNYPLMRLASITQLIEKNGFRVKLIPLGFKYFPVNLTRIAIFGERTEVV